jgi:glycosyltransferase involved in cell wall biosynthesis
MKIFAWMDSPTVATGFGVVSKNLSKKFHEMGHEIIILGINEYGQNPRELQKFPFPIYPCNPGGPEQVYGFGKIWNIIQHENPDIFFMLNDPWLIKNVVDLRPPNSLPLMKTVGYYPVDSAPLKPDWLKALNGLDAQVCYSKYAENVIAKSNGAIPNNLHQIYHGVDTKTFFPVNQSQARRYLGIPENLFVVGMVARNQPRKRFDLLMMAFAQFAKDKENVKLYLHTALKDIGFDILDIARQLNIADKLILTEDITPSQGVSDERLNYIYNSFDINALISLGDGFGLPVAESMATGCVQLVSGHSCLQELVEDHGGLTVKNTGWLANSSGINTWGGVSDYADIAEKLNLLYRNKELRFKHAEEGYRFILDKKFTWDYAANEFNKIFKQVLHILEVPNVNTYTAIPNTDSAGRNATNNSKQIQSTVIT